jgi:hypothetical protein
LIVTSNFSIEQIYKGTKITGVDLEAIKQRFVEFNCDKEYNKHTRLPNSQVKHFLDWNDGYEKELEVEFKK